MVINSEDTKVINQITMNTIELAFGEFKRNYLKLSKEEIFDNPIENYFKSYFNRLLKSTISFGHKKDIMIDGDIHDFVIYHGKNYLTVAYVYWTDYYDTYDVGEEFLDLLLEKFREELYND